jgi:hypothetical protein
MDFVVVANDDLATLGRQLAHALSVQKNHSGAFWSVKHYKDNEAQLGGKQPVIFLGDNEIANSYVDVLPERFSSFGVKCVFEGAKAVLVADEPEDVSTEELQRLKLALENNQKELHNLAASARSEKASEATMGETALQFKIFADLVTASFFGAAVDYLILRFWTARKRKQEYRKLQYDYALTCFLKDGFENFIGGIRDADDHI